MEIPEKLLQELSYNLLGKQRKARERFKIVREIIGSQESFAEKLDRDPRYIQKIESGERRISVKLAKKVRDVIKDEFGADASIAYLMGIGNEELAIDRSKAIEAAREDALPKIEAILRRNQSALDHFAILSDAAEAHGLKLYSIFDPDIDNPSVLSYLRSVTWSKQIPDRIFLLEQDGQPVKQLSGEEYERLAAKLRDYAAQLINEAITE